jgi:hypothetical protein
MDYDIILLYDETEMTLDTRYRVIELNLVGHWGHIWNVFWKIHELSNEERCFGHQVFSSSCRIPE